MGKQVTVDSDDLETLLFSTGVVKQMEQIIQQRNGDPFVQIAPAILKAAHDRVAAEWRRVMREPHPSSNEPVSMDALLFLRQLPMLGGNRLKEITHAMMMAGHYHELHTKLMIEYGNLHEMVYWSSSQERQKLNMVARIVVRMTPRGYQLLERMQKEGGSIAQ